MKKLASFLSMILLLLPLYARAVDMQISQLVDSPDPAVRGGEINYQITVLNSTNDTANNVSFNFPLPSTTTFVAVDDSRCAHVGATPGQVSCLFGSVTGDGLGGNSITLNIRIASTATTGNSVSVTGTVTTSSTDTNPANNSLTQNTTIDNGADLSLTVTDVADPVIAGGAITYQITVNNAGPNDANNIRVTNTLPPAVTYSGFSGTGWSCTHTGGSPDVVTCTTASLVVGSVASILTINGTVTGAVAGIITDSASVTAATRDPNENNNTITENTTINQGADLAITQSVTTPVIANSATLFTFTPQNNGPFDVNQAQFTDTFPAGFSGITVTQADGWNCLVSGQTLTCDLATFTAGASNTITVTAIAPASGSVNNTVTISNNSAMPDPVAANDSDSVNITVIPDGADLSISKTKSPDPVAQGSNTTSAITVTNLGPQTTTGTLTVTDTLDSGETFVSGSGTNWSCNNSGASPDVVTCTYTGSLAANAQASPLSIVTKAVNTGNLTNTACAVDAGGQTDAVTGNDCASATVTSTGLKADLSVTKSADAGGDTTLASNENSISYTITVTNAVGSDPASGIVMTDTIPGFISGSTGVVVTNHPANYSCTTGSTVTCTQTSGALAAGASDSFTITVTRPLLDGNLNNTASAYSSTLGDPNRANNTATATVAVVPIADIQLVSKTVAPAEVKAGVEATYVISVKNNGPSAAQNVVMTDVFTPPSTCGSSGNAACQFTWIAATTNKAGASCTTDSPAVNQVQCQLGTIASGATYAVTIKIRPDWDAGNQSWTLPNTASVTTTTVESVAGGDNGNNSQSASLSIIAAQLDLLVNDTDVVDPVGYDATNPSNNIIVYKIDVTNRGPSLATGVVLTDAMTPKNGKSLTFLCDDAGSTTCATGTSICDQTNTGITGPATLTLSCPLPDLAANTTTTRYLFFRVDSAPDGTGDTHNNVATIRANESDSNALNDVEAETTSVRTLVDVAVTKTPSQASVNINEPFNWLIQVVNNGPGDSNDTQLNDTLPPGMELTGVPVTSSGSCTGTTGDSSFSCQFGTLAMGGTVSLTIPVRLTAYPAGGTSTNTATVTTFGVDSNPGNNSASGTVTVTQSSVAGVVYTDLNNDGIKGGGETGIAGVTITLSGTDIYGNPVSRTQITAADGTYSFANLPPSSPAGYTLTETQPAGFVDGKDTVGDIAGSTYPGNDQFHFVLPASTTGSGYNFGEIGTSQVASISGRVWLDQDHDRRFLGGATDTPQSGWIVELLQNGTVISTQTTDNNGQYHFVNLFPGSGYQIRFRHPVTQTIWGQAVPNEQGLAYTSGVDDNAGNPAGAETTDGTLANLTLVPGDNIVEQSLPLDPAGMVYDAMTRQPVAGAVVTITGPPGFDPALHTVGGSASMTTGADGLYQFLIIPGAPDGIYTLSITAYPAGYIPSQSALIPACQNTLTVNTTTIGPDPALVQPLNTAPALGVTAHDPATCPANTTGFPINNTQYYLRFALTTATAPYSVNIVNNHIPLDPVLADALAITKTTPKKDVVRGELVPYTITASNTLSVSLTNIALQDYVPAGFKYVAGSATINGVKTEPVVQGRKLTWSHQTFAPMGDAAHGDIKTIQLMLIVGAGVSDGDYINQAWAENTLANSRVSSIASAAVRVVPDPLFDCTDLIGKVFDDKNINGYQDEGEPGLAGVRVVTPRGVLLTTDNQGRFHLACAAVPNELHGSNFILKLDERTLPSGYRLTTENPRVVRMTRGKLVKLNFGAALHRVIRVDLDTRTFEEDKNTLTASAQQQFTSLLAILKQQPSILRVRYHLNKYEDTVLAQARLALFVKQITARWQACDCHFYTLNIEQEMIPAEEGEKIQTGRIK